MNKPALSRMGGLARPHNHHPQSPNLRDSGPSSPERSVGAGSTLDRRREAVEVYPIGFDFPGEGTDGEKSAVAVPPRSADAAEAQAMRDRR